MQSHKGAYARTSTTPTRTSSKNIISRYGNNFVVTPKSFGMERVYQLCRKKNFHERCSCLGRKLIVFRQVLTSSKQPQIWSVHVVVWTRTAKKSAKSQYERVGRAGFLFSFINPIVALS